MHQSSNSHLRVAKSVFLTAPSISRREVSGVGFSSAQNTSIKPVFSIFWFLLLFFLAIFLSVRSFSTLTQTSAGVWVGSSTSGMTILPSSP